MRYLKRFSKVHFLLTLPLDTSTRLLVLTWIIAAGPILMLPTDASKISRSSIVTVFLMFPESGVQYPDASGAGLGFEARLGLGFIIVLSSPYYRLSMTMVTIMNKLRDFIALNLFR